MRPSLELLQNIHITLDENNYLTVVDDGRGIPVEEHPDKKISTLELILTTLHGRR